MSTNPDRLFRKLHGEPNEKDAESLRSLLLEAAQPITLDTFDQVLRAPQYRGNRLITNAVRQASEIAIETGTFIPPSAVEETIRDYYLNPSLQKTAICILAGAVALGAFIHELANQPQYSPNFYSGTPSVYSDVRIPILHKDTLCTTYGNVRKCVELPLKKERLVR
jgi:hypothetical protein